MAHNPKNKKEVESRVERRIFTLPVGIETREGKEDSRTVVGYAAVFDKWSAPIYGWFREKIAPTAFDKVLDQDTVCLFNHDKNLILARNNATLKLSVDKTGLRYEFEAPNTSLGNDLLENIRLKNITKSSFAFTTKSAEWTKSEEEGLEEDRTILEVEDLIDVSPVTFPAYPDASVDMVAKREFESYCKENRESEENMPEVNTDFEITKAKLRLRKHSV